MSTSNEAAGQAWLSFTRIRPITIVVPIVVAAALIGAATVALPDVSMTTSGHAFAVVFVALAAVICGPAIRDPASGRGRRSLLGMPVVAHGETEGMLLLADPETGAPDQDGIALVRQVAEQVGVEIHRADPLGELIERNSELQRNNELATDLAAARDLPAVLDVVLRAIVDTSDAGYAGLWLAVDEGYELRHELGEHPRADDEASTLAATALRRSVQASGRPRYETQEGLGLGCLPLRSHGEPMAIACFVSVDPAVLTPGRRRSLASIADCCGPAISNARLRLRVREAAVIEERERIAREMHDGFAQVLGYVNGIAGATRRYLELGQVDDAAALLSDLEAAVGEASKDVREELLALHTTDRPDTSLPQALRDYIAKFERFSGVDVGYRESGVTATLQLPEMTRLQVVRIAQEALSNVRKHAGTLRATVSLTVSDGRLLMDVDDQGLGFGVRSGADDGRGALGLQTMRERAASVGGELDVTSEPGQGTRVRLAVPLEPAGMAAP